MKKNEIWLDFEWPGIHWYQVVHPFLFWMNDFGKYGKSLTKIAASYSRGTTAFFVIKKEYEDSGRQYFELVKKNPKKMFGVLKKVERAAFEIFKLGKKWQGTDFKKVSDKELISIHQKLFKWDKELWQKGQVQNLLEFHNSYLSQHVKELIIRKFDKNSLNDVFKILTTSNYNSITERQDEDFVKLFKKADLKRINAHWRKYTWMTYGWAGPALTYEYFEDTIKTAKKNREIVKEILARINEKRVLLRQQKTLLSKFEGLEKQLVLLLKAILEAKAIRVDAHSMTYFIADRLMSEIGKRLSLSVNQLRVIEPSAVPKLFKGYDIDKINEKYNLVLFWYAKPNKYKEMIGIEARKKIAYIKSRLPKIKPVNELKGELAYAGKTRGKIKVILDIKDASRFKEGEILVTRITDPSYVPLMKKAKAIVTDIGGITSHAAIVSRELHKICIVGTNIATKVLKDGDMVEVDANKGIVRKV